MPVDLSSRPTGSTHQSRGAVAKPPQAKQSLIAADFKRNSGLVYPNARLEKACQPLKHQTRLEIQLI